MRALLRARRLYYFVKASYDYEWHWEKPSSVLAQFKRDPGAKLELELSTKFLRFAESSLFHCVRCWNDEHLEEWKWRLLEKSRYL